MRRTSVMTALALVAATLVTLFSPATAAAATGTFDAAVDATLSEDTPDLNDGTGDTLEIYGPTDELTADAVRSVISWDLSSIPQGSTITDASVAFTVSDDGDDAIGYPLLRAWDDGAVTWNSADGAVPWATPGADDTTSDRSSAAIGTLELGTIGGTTMDLDPDVVEGWVTEPTSNHGFVLVSAENNNGAFVRSADAADEAERPTLTVTYTEPAPIVVTTTSPLTAGTEDAPYTATLEATGGSGTLAWTITDGALPTGVTLAADGTLSGTPTVAGSFSFTATATDIYDEVGSQAFTLEIAAAPDGGSLIGITPERVVNTRLAADGPCVDGPREFAIAPSTGVPAGAAAVALNVTVTQATGNGYLSVFPSDAANPGTSNLNFAAGQTVPNSVISQLSPDGEITVFANAGCPHVIVDVVGYFTEGTPGPGGFVGITPNRAVNTRLPADGPCVTGAREFTIAPSTGVPAGAAAVALNVTVTQATGNGYLSVFPSDAANPGTSSVNFAAGQTVPNSVISQLSPDGEITVFANAGCPHVIVDVVGYFTEGTPGPGGFVGITPNRAVNTRLAADGPCVDGPREFTIAPSTGVPADAAAVALNVTVTQATGNGYLSVFPSDAANPGTSNLNFAAGQTVPNSVISKLSPDGEITVFANAGCPHVIVDVVGYYVGEAI